MATTSANSIPRPIRARAPERGAALGCPALPHWAKYHGAPRGGGRHPHLAPRCWGGGSSAVCRPCPRAHPMTLCPLPPTLCSQREPKNRAPNQVPSGYFLPVGRCLVAKYILCVVRSVVHGSLHSTDFILRGCCASPPNPTAQTPLQMLLVMSLLR